SQGRILIQFADDATLAQRQIERTSELLSLRDQAEFLTLNFSLPDRFYVQIADALRLGIEGSIDPAKHAMRAVLNDLLGQRLASSRLQYYLLGAGTAAVIVAVLAGLQGFLPS